MKSAKCWAAGENFFKKKTLPLKRGFSNEEICDGDRPTVVIPIVIRVVAVDIQVALARVLVEVEIPELPIYAQTPSMPLPQQYCKGLYFTRGLKTRQHLRQVSSFWRSLKNTAALRDSPKAFWFYNDARCASLSLSRKCYCIINILAYLFAKWNTPQ